MSAPPESTPPSAGSPFGQRPSKSAAEAWQSALQRIQAMTVRERMIAALSLKERTSLFLTRTARKPPSEDPSGPR